MNIPSSATTLRKNSRSLWSSMRTSSETGAAGIYVDADEMRAPTEV
jgi:hypothetical protein